MVENDYLPLIKYIYKTIPQYWNDDSKLLGLFRQYHTALFRQIHNELVPLKTEDAEKQIRELIAKYVIGFTEKKTRVKYVGCLEWLRNKIGTIREINAVNREYVAKYSELYNDFMALASFRSYKHFCQYLEQYTFGITLWKDNERAFSGYWYYANRMILDGSINFLEKQLPTGTGKCQLYNTLVRTPNGIKQLGDIQVGESVYSMRDNKVCVQKVTNKWFTHKKQVKVTTRGGLEITVSPEHRLYTQKGYVSAENLSCSDYLYRLCKPINCGIKQNQDELEFATLMLFGGHCVSGNLSFTNEDDLIIQKFISVCEKLGFDYIICQNGDSKAKSIYINNNQGVPDEILAKYGILNTLSKDKKLSKLFLDLPLKQRYDFIGLMLATDGYIFIGNSEYGAAGITLASKDLVIGIQQLLNSCGIYSYFSNKDVKSNNTDFNTYALNIANEYFHIIAENCYCYQKQGLLLEKNKQYSQKLTNVVCNDFVWEQIKSIEFIDEIADMVDIEVENTHNFIANDIVSHNSISDAFMHAYIFGYDIDNDVFKVCGNDKFTDDCFNNVVKIMTTPLYAKVFPYFRQFDCKENLMFNFCSVKDLKFSIVGSAKSTNLRICTKLSKTNGVRAKYLFVDDITQQDDTSSDMAKDKIKFMREWFRRNYNLKNFFIVASGTAYSQFDLLSWLKQKNNFEHSEVSKVNEFTYIAKSEFIHKDGVAAFVIVPALDKNDKSVFPTIRSTDALIRMRIDDYETFMAMEQQSPLPPETTPFYFTKLRQYTTLPNIGELGRMENCVAALDTKRRGKDYLSMPIFFEADDPDRKGEKVYYLVDWIYDDRTMKDCIPLIVSKIINHHITRLYAERNTEECIESLLQDKLKEQGYTSCVIEEVFSTEPKDRRIMVAEGDIKAKMIFPQYNMYSPSHNIGKALMNVYGYTYTRKNVHDDAPDSLALFAKKFIDRSSSLRKKAKFLYL